MKILFILFFMVFYLVANDAEYVTSANGLVPIKSENIELKKEILNITKLKNGYFQVNIEYKLFNKGEAKSTLIGFEAPQPIGEDNMPNQFFYKNYNIAKKQKAELEAIEKNKKVKGNSGIYNFKIEVNGKKLSYKVVDVSAVKGGVGSTPYVGYLYYFHTNLKKGTNTIKQSYKCFTGGAVNSRYEFEYILATAKEWSGGKIGQIEINLNMGAFESFEMEPSFFDNLDNWIIKNGIARYEKSRYSDKKNILKFYLIDGKATFKAKNFIPKDGIIILSWHNYRVPDAHEKILFNYKKSKLPLCIYYNKKILKECSAYNCFAFFARDYKSLKILKNLPFARRGYIFKTDFIANYYSKIPWYKKDTNYKATMASLTQKERLWLQSIEKLKPKILRNLPYAKRGYIFKDNRLNHFYTLFDWYKPNQNYTPKSSDLSSYELAFVKKIKNKKTVSDKEFFKLLLLPQ